MIFALRALVGNKKISAITDKFLLLVTDLQLSQPCLVRQIARGSLFLLILAQMISPILEIFPNLFPGKYWIYLIIKWASSRLSVLVVDVPKNPTKTMFKILPRKKNFLWALEMSIPIKRSDFWFEFSLLSLISSLIKHKDGLLLFGGSNRVHLKGARKKYSLGYTGNITPACMVK